MELRHLRYFLTAAETLHFGRAATRLGIAQPPLSRQIRDLEDEIGTPLFHRNARGVILTDAGVVFAQKSAEIMAATKEAVTDARDAAAGRVGRLVIGFIPSLAYSLLPEVLPGFKRLHPDVTVSLREIAITDKESALLSEHIDVGLYRPPPRHPEISYALLGEESFLLVLPANHPLAKKRQISVQALRNERLILFPARLGDVGLYGTIANFLRQHGVPVEAGEEAGTIQTALGLVMAGAGVTIVPKSSAVLRIKGLVFRPFREPTTTASLSVCWRMQEKSHLVAAFRDYLCEKLHCNIS